MASGARWSSAPAAGRTDQLQVRGRSPLSDGPTTWLDDHAAAPGRRMPTHQRPTPLRGSAPSTINPPTMADSELIQGHEQPLVPRCEASPPTTSRSMRRPGRDATWIEHQQPDASRTNSGHQTEWNVCARFAPTDSCVSALITCFAGQSSWGRRESNPHWLEPRSTTHRGGTGDLGEQQLLGTGSGT